MEEYNIIKRVLERNGMENIPILPRLSALDYMTSKMKCEQYTINIKVETAEITDETVWMKFTHVIDYDEEVDFITDICITTTDKSTAMTEGKNLMPAVYEESYADGVWRENYFIYDDKLIAILAVGNAEICFKICDLSEFMQQYITVAFDNPAKLSLEEVKAIMDGTVSMP